MLNEEQIAIRDMAHDFSCKELAPNASTWDEDQNIPDKVIENIGELGFLGVQIPEIWGGSGLGNIDLSLIIEEIAAGEGGISTLVAVQNSVVCMPIYNYGSDSQKQKYLKKLATGKLIGAFMLTESHTGSDASAIKTQAKIVGNKYVLNGSKSFVSNGNKADIAITFAVTDAEAGSKGISAFIVPTNSPGFNVDRIEKKLGQRSSDTCSISLSNTVHHQ